MSDQLGATSEEETVPYEPHVGMTRPYVRDIILGVNDGLVSIFLLVAGVVGGNLTITQVLLAALAGAIAGAVSMAAGEYLATQSQEEVFDREIALERTHIAHHRDMEVAQLGEMFEEMGIAEDDLAGVVAAFARDDETLLNAMKVLEFGVVDAERRSPYRAMVMSGITFLGGSLPPVLPFFFVSSSALGLVLAAVFTALGLFAVGAAKTTITTEHPVTAGLQNLVIAGVGGILAFFVGGLVNALIG